VTRFRFEKGTSLIRSFVSSRVKVFRYRWRYQSYQGLYDDSQRRILTNLYKMIENVIVGDASITMEKEDTTRL